MKCPLIKEKISSDYSPLVYGTIDCLKAECAWWCVPHKECSIVSIALNLKDVDGAVQSVANNLRQ